MTNTETPKILVLPGDGIGPEIVNEAVKVLDCLRENGLSVDVEHGLIGGAAYDETKSPFPAQTISQAENCDAICVQSKGC
jgi:3-isopropylmalate dehydrogenase